MPKVNREPPDKIHIQAILFEKEEGWTKKKCEKWLKDHKHYISGFHETDDHYRYKQYDNDSKTFHYRYKEIGKGIKLLLGIPKKMSDNRKAHGVQTFPFPTMIASRVSHFKPEGDWDGAA